VNGGAVELESIERVIELRGFTNLHISFSKSGPDAKRVRKLLKSAPEREPQTKFAGLAGPHSLSETACKSGCWTLYPSMIRV
jgi:hypothetical protein